MSEEITVSWGTDRRLIRRALNGFWRSAVPPQPFFYRALGWAGFWMVAAIATGSLSVFGLSPWYALAALIGALVPVAAFGVLQRTRMRSFMAVIADHWTRAGETLAVFAPSGATVTDAVSRRELSWAAIDAVRATRGATVLRSGISVIAVPDTALPAGLSPESFRTRIEAWRTAP